MTSARCIKCDALKPLWSTHRLCPKCRRASKTVKVIQSNEVVNVLGEPVKIVPSQQVVVITKAYTRSSRTCMAHTRMIFKKIDGRLVAFNDKIYLSGGWYHKWDAEIVAQTLSCESIHLAMFRIGLGTENNQFDKMKLHSWETREESLEEYYGIAIKQYGLRAEG